MPTATAKLTLLKPLVSQAELRRFKRLESLIIRMEADKKVLEAKIALAFKNKAPIQDGVWQAVETETPARASTSWKELYAAVVGDAVVAEKEAEAKIAAKNKPGTKKISVLKKETN